MKILLLLDENKDTIKDYAYIQGEENYTCCDEKLKNGYEVYDIDLDINDFLNTSNGELYETSLSAILNSKKCISNKNQKEIEELKQYLNETDYVITKLNELKLEDEDEYEKAKTEYAEILTKRKEARKKINELENTML